MATLTPSYLLNTIRELERENATLKLQLEMEREKKTPRIQRAPEQLPLIPHTPVRTTAQMDLPLRRKEGAKYIEGVAYAVNTGASKGKRGRDFKVTPEPMRVLPNDKMAEEFIHERRYGAGAIVRIGACIIEDERG